MKTRSFVKKLSLLFAALLLIFIALGSTPTMTETLGATNTPQDVGEGVLLADDGSSLAPRAIAKIPLADGWKIQSSTKVSEGGAVISTTNFNPQGWYAATVPSTVLAALVQDGVYPDPFYSKNMQSIPTSNFTSSWWYRKDFTIPASEAGKRVLLNFKGINYRANIWLNGVQIANSTQIVGTFRTWELDVTGKVNNGTNVLAVEVIPMKSGELGMTFVDWAPKPPDGNMGLWQEVYLATSGSVVIRNPLVTTNLDIPSLTTARLTVTADVTNLTGSSVSGTLQGSTGSAQFSQNVSLAANETKKVTFTYSSYPQLNISNPALWWPWELGPQNLQDLNLNFSVGGITTDTLTTKFGIRQITSRLTSQGHRLFTINGRDILIRGAGYAPDLFLRMDHERYEKELSYVKDMNLNTIRLEGKFEDDYFYDLCDQLGILVMHGWCCCDAWEAQSTWTTENHTVAPESLKSQMRRFNIHPSSLVWLYGSDNLPTKVVEQEYLDAIKEVQWPNPTISSATGGTTSLSGATGVKMLGPYEWEPPIYWEADTNHGGAYGFNTEVGPGGAPPPLESLQKMLPADHLWPIDDYWNYHCGLNQFNNINVFTKALSNRYGTASSVADYSKKAQVAAYESHRAMFEAFGAKKYTATGEIQWMLNNAWPSMIWHLYDYYLRPGGSYYGTKTACEPLHIQYSYKDQSVIVVNSYNQSFSNLKAVADVYNLDATNKYHKEATVSIGNDGVNKVFTLPQITGLSSAYFVRLTLKDSNSKDISVNSYWLSTKADVLSSSSSWYLTDCTSFSDMTALQSLPSVSLQVSSQTERKGDREIQHVTVNNPSSSIAFAVHLKVKKEMNGGEVLPILWQDNYFMLLPGESRTIDGSYLVKDLANATPVVEVDGWNVPSNTVLPSTPPTTNTPTTTPTSPSPITGYKISGFVKPDLQSADPNIQAGFKVEISGTGMAATTNSSGYFEIINVPVSTTGYMLKINKLNYLTREIPNIIVRANVQLGSESEPLGVWAGDIDVSGVQDKVINMADIMEIAKAFNTVAGSDKYNASVDFDLDNAINMSDIMIVVKHFNKAVSDYPVVTPVNSTPVPTPVMTPTKASTNTPTPTLKPTLVSTPTNAGYPTWDPNNHGYTLGDKVSYQGSNYQCTYAHTSNAGWAPDAANTLWQKI